MSNFDGPNAEVPSEPVAPTTSIPAAPSTPVQGPPDETHNHEYDHEHYHHHHHGHGYGTVLVPRWIIRLILVLILIFVVFFAGFAAGLRHSDRQGRYSCGPVTASSQFNCGYGFQGGSGFRYNQQNQNRFVHPDTNQVTAVPSPSISDYPVAPTPVAPTAPVTN